MSKEFPTETKIISKEILVPAEAFLIIDLQHGERNYNKYKQEAYTGLVQNDQYF